MPATLVATAIRTVGSAFSNFGRRPTSLIDLRARDLYCSAHILQNGRYFFQVLDNLSALPGSGQVLVGPDCLARYANIRTDRGRAMHRRRCCGKLLVVAALGHAAVQVFENALDV
jgi:hypothetical protein